MYFNENQKARTIYMYTVLSSPYSVHLTSWHNDEVGQTQKVNSEYWKYTWVGYGY